MVADWSISTEAIGAVLILNLVLGNVLEHKCLSEVSSRQFVWDGGT